MAIDYLALAQNQQRNRQLGQADQRIAQGFKQLELQQARDAVNASYTNALTDQVTGMMPLNQEAKRLANQLARQRNPLLIQQDEANIAATEAGTKSTEAQTRKTEALLPGELLSQKITRQYNQQLTNQSRATTEQTNFQTEQMRKLAANKEQMEYLNEVKAMNKTLLETTQEGSKERIEAMQAMLPQLKTLNQRYGNSGIQLVSDNVTPKNLTDESLSQTVRFVDNLKGARDEISSGQETFLGGKERIDPETGERVIVREGSQGTEKVSRFLPADSTAQQNLEFRQQQAEEKRLLAERKQQKSERERQGRVAQTLRNINETLDNTNIFSTGIIGKATRALGIESGDAGTLASDITSIKSALAQDAIQTMKDNSPTGATGLGQVTNIEIELLQSMVENLNPNLSEDQVRKDLQSVRDHYLKVQELLVGDVQYVETYGDLQKLKPGDRYWEPTSGTIKTFEIDTTR